MNNELITKNRISNQRFIKLNWLVMCYENVCNGFIKCLWGFFSTILTPL